MTTVANQTARFALTKTQIQNGDTVKQIDTGVMYFVIDDTNLNNAAGYTEYTAATASKVTTTVAAGQVSAIAYAVVGGDDGVAIRAGSTGNNVGYLELATADDGNEPIYVRQYSSGAGVSENSFTTAIRTATLLDSNGNTSFPGTLTASKIYNAVYNDYAEFFEKAADTAFEPGDIIALDMDSEKEQYVKATENSIVIVGVVTDEYAYIIGGEKGSLEKNEKKYIPVSLMGRVHVKVDDTVKRGDKITASSIPGIGRKAKPNEHSIGTALTNPVNGTTRILINI